MIAYALNNIGVEIELKWWNWNIIMPRLFLDPMDDPIGANYENGGFDAYFIGFGASADPDYSGQYYNESFAPAGDNSMYVERSDFQEIIKRSLESPLEADRLQALKEYQAWFYEWVPKSIIRQGLDTFPQDPDLSGFDTYNYGRYPWIHNLTHAGAETTLTSLVPGDFVDFNPMVSNSWYDSVPMSNSFLSLSARRGIYDLAAYPMLAESWNQSVDGKEWTVNLRQGIKFSDGSEITADDVVESYRVALNASASTYAGDMVTWFANDTDIYAKDDYTIQFKLQIFYPYVTTAVFGVPIMQAAQLREIGMDALKTDASNTNQPMDLVVNGPYMPSAYITNELTMVPNPEYNGTALGHNATDKIFLESTGQFDTYVCTVVKEATTAVASLSAGTCDLMDPNQGIFGQIEELEAAAWANVVTAPEYGWQELAYNHYDPRWGLNPHDPEEMYGGVEPTTTESEPVGTEETTEPDTEEPTDGAPGFELIMVIMAIGVIAAVRPLRKK
jgi:ABC-type transport system substrate-binding protein